jgi:hypothetical protein
MMCASCMCERHEHAPLHHIEVGLSRALSSCIVLMFFQEWSNGSFRRTTLYDLGLVVRVGHDDGAMCERSQPASSTFTVIHTNGVHHIRLYFCGCGEGVEPWRQLMRARLWPATVRDPRTAATFDVMRQFEKLNAFGHVNATDYYRALVHLSDAKRHTPMPVSVSSLCPLCLRFD